MAQQGSPEAASAGREQTPARTGTLTLSRSPTPSPEAATTGHEQTPTHTLARPQPDTDATFWVDVPSPKKPHPSTKEPSPSMSKPTMKTRSSTASLPKKRRSQATSTCVDTSILLDCPKTVNTSILLDAPRPSAHLHPAQLPQDHRHTSILLDCSKTVGTPSRPKSPPSTARSLQVTQVSSILCSIVPSHPSLLHPVRSPPSLLQSSARSPQDRSTHLGRSCSRMRPDAPSITSTQDPNTPWAFKAEPKDSTAQHTHNPPTHTLSH
ncbi:hypothetical protein CF336_g6603 [Tilletia laevis]|nr:hypothetical protein CF336_g6603 [Tilletia laevis]